MFMGGAFLGNLVVQEVLKLTKSDGQLEGCWLFFIVVTTTIYRHWQTVCCGFQRTTLILTDQNPFNHLKLVGQKCDWWDYTES